MESATIAAQGYRFRVPYGTLLCVSDKQLHGELKLPGQANRCYEEAIAAHLQIGIRACVTMRDEGAKLHSRKLRDFNEPPFRSRPEADVVACCSIPFRGEKIGSDNACTPVPNEHL